MMRSFLRAGFNRPGVLLQSRWPLKVDRPARGTANIARAVQMTEHALYIEEVAVSQSPKRLGALIKTLVAQGGTALLPSDRYGLHPLLIPLVCETADSERVTCLLRWPKPSAYKGMSQPVVRMSRGGKCMTLVARSVDEYLHRLLMQEDEAGPGPKPLADAAGEAGLSLYQAGDLAAAGLPPGKTQMYIIKKIGMFPDVNEALAKGHLAKGDVVSALVASEWYMRNNHYPGWARPYEFAAELLTGLSRAEEARDMARASLQLPWWTLEGGYEATRDMAQLQGTPQEVRYNLSEEATAAAQAKLSQGVSFRETRPAQEVALDKAAALLDMVVAGVEPSYESVRERLIEAYKGAGLTDVANFILSAS